MMNDRQLEPLKVPKFENESDEADWWYSQREELGRRFVAAGEAGTLRRGGAARQLAELRARRAAKEAEAASLEPIRLDPIRLEPDDARKAHALAAQRGLPYEDLVRKLVHDALERELSLAS